MEGTQHNIYQVELLDYHMLEEDMKSLHNLREKKWQIKACFDDIKIMLCGDIYVYTKMSYVI